MSFAYEVTPDEVYEVLEAHGVAQSAEDDIVDDGYATVAELEDRITEAVLEYADAGNRRAPGRAPRRAPASRRILTGSWNGHPARPRMPPPMPCR